MSNAYDPDGKGLSELLEDMRTARAKETAATLELKDAVIGVKEAVDNLSMWINERENALAHRDEVQTAIIANLIRNDIPGSTNGSGARHV